jgi:hypothetical protein
MDEAERILLSRARPPFPRALLGRRAVLERETYYFGQCRGGDAVDVDASIQLAPPNDGQLARSESLVDAAELTASFAIYHRGTGDLLVAARARKVFVVPRAEQVLFRDAQRLCDAHLPGKAPR